MRHCRRPTWLRPCLLFRKRLHAPFKRDESPPPLKIAHALAQYPPTTTSDTVVAQNSVEVFSPWLAIRKAATFYQQRQTPEFSVCRELSGCLGTTEKLFVDKNSPAIETIGCLRSVNSAEPSVDLKKTKVANTLVSSARQRVTITCQLRSKPRRYRPGHVESRLCKHSDKNRNLKRVW